MGNIRFVFSFDLFKYMRLCEDHRMEFTVHTYLTAEEVCWITHLDC